MRSHDDIELLTTQRIAVGLSAIIGVTLIASQTATTWKYFSGGSLEIVNGTSPSPWGLGYIVGTSEIFNCNMTGTFYLAASGATAVVHLVRGLGP